MRINRRLLVAIPVLAVLMVGGWWLFGGHEVPAGQPPLVTLDGTTLADLKADFNASSDAVRVILLMSPT